MGEAVLSAAAAAQRWLTIASSYRSPPRPLTRDLYLEALPGWAEMYVGGWWSLERFEAHADAMREAMFRRN